MLNKTCELQAANEFTGQERIGDLIPKWVAEAVLHQRFPAAPELKCAFMLVPGEVGFIALSRAGHVKLLEALFCMKQAGSFAGIGPTLAPAESAECTSYPQGVQGRLLRNQ